MMVTVAKTLDVPIKLVFPRPAHPDSPSTAPSLAMLGLGDVVLPGIMMGLALRFDLFLFYLRRQKRTPAVEQADGTVGEESVEKPRYFSLAGRWTDHFWTHSLTGRPLFIEAKESKPEPPFTFPKTYFKASLVGYILGMLATLGVMHIWGHAQPALLYLVPGVLGSLWLTALFKGELSLMWDFSEAVEDEEVKSSEEKSGEEKVETTTSKSTPERTSFFSLSEKKSIEREKRMEKALRKHVTIDSESEDSAVEEVGILKKKNNIKKVVGHKEDREVFSFSIEAPWQLKHPRSIHKSSRESKEAVEEEPSSLEKEKPNWAPPSDDEKPVGAIEPAGKRIRLK
jgi:minor histocompatibility antigen H13